MRNSHIIEIVEESEDKLRTTLVSSGSGIKSYCPLVLQLNCFNFIVQTN